MPTLSQFTNSNPSSVTQPLWNRATSRAFFFLVLCLILSGAIILFFTSHKSKMDACAYNVIQAAHSIQDFARKYGYKTGDQVDNLWPRLYLFMEEQYDQGSIKHKPLRVCPDTGQEYNCSNIIPEPGTPVILCEYPPHRQTIRIVP